LRGSRLPFPDSPTGFVPGYVRPAPDLSLLTPAERPAIARALAPIPQNRWPSCGELLAELRRATAPPPEPAAPVERRQGERRKPGAGVTCRVHATLGNESWRAAVLNLSARGARLRVERPGCPLRPGRELELELHHGAAGKRVAVRLRLTHGS